MSRDRTLLLTVLSAAVFLAGCANLPDDAKQVADRYMQYFISGSYPAMWEMFDPREREDMDKTRFIDQQKKIARFGPAKTWKIETILNSSDYGGTVYEPVYRLDFGEVLADYGVQVLRRPNGSLTIVNWSIETWRK